MLARVPGGDASRKRAPITRSRTRPSDRLTRSAPRTTAPRGDGRTGFAAGAYVVPGDAAQLNDLALATPAPAERGQVPGSGRRLAVPAARDDLVWFDARALCDQPTSAQDYLSPLPLASPPGSSATCHPWPGAARTCSSASPPSSTSSATGTSR